MFSEQEPELHATRYFWSDWFTGQSVGLLYTTFVLLSTADLLATYKLLLNGVKEGNALANYVLRVYGIPGMFVYKILLVVIFGLSILFISRREPRLAQLILWGGILLMGVIALIHLTIMLGLAL